MAWSSLFSFVYVRLILKYTTAYHDIKKKLIEVSRPKKIRGKYLMHRILSFIDENKTISSLLLLIANGVLHGSFSFFFNKISRIVLADRNDPVKLVFCHETAFDTEKIRFSDSIHLEKSRHSNICVSHYYWSDIKKTYNK